MHYMLAARLKSLVRRQLMRFVSSTPEPSFVQVTAASDIQTDTGPQHQGEQRTVMHTPQDGVPAYDAVPKYALPFFPYHPDQRSYMLSNLNGEFTRDQFGLPIPPESLWIGYGDDVESYLQLGREDANQIRSILEQAGSRIEKGDRVLDFGCGAGRILRWFAPLAEDCELWGVDINAENIWWCEQHLHPPFHFATTTLLPHLPFEDQYFNLVYVSSVFTHIDDLAKTWFLELRRTLKPGGYLYITIHDQNTIERLDRIMYDFWLTKHLHSHPEYDGYIASDFGMFTIGRSTESQVFYDVVFLSKMLEPFYQVISVKPEAHVHQTAVLLRRM